MFSEFELRRGKVAAAYAATAESVQLAAETGQADVSSFSLVVLARAEAVLGHDEDCRAHIAAGLEFSRRTGSDTIESTRQWCSDCWSCHAAAPSAALST